MNVNESEILNKIIERNGYLEINFEDFFIDIEKKYEKREKIAEEVISFLRQDKKNIEKIFKLYCKNNNFAGNYQQMLFRGQGSSEWKLDPSLYRGEEKVNSDVCLREYSILNSFVEGCDKAGVQLPSDNFEFRDLFIGDDFIQSYKAHDTNWFHKKYYEISALAQHYGLPTRLLDWSNHPLVSLYFASASAIREMKNTSFEKNNKFFSVWIISHGDIENFFKKINPSDNDDTFKADLAFISPPKSFNSHLSAQSGYLSFVKQDSNKANLNFLFGVVTDNSPKLVNDVLHKYNLSHLLLKLNIPYECAGILYNYCSLLNFNAAHLYKGHEGASQYVMEQQNYFKYEASKFKKNK